MILVRKQVFVCLVHIPVFATNLSVTYLQFYPGYAHCENGG